MPDTPGNEARNATPMADAMVLLAHWNYTLTAFYLRRFRQQAELPMKLVGTASLSDMMDIGRAFEADLLADYADHAALLHGHAQAASPGGAQEPASYGAELLKAQNDDRALLDQAKLQAERIVAAAEARAAELVAAADGRRPPPRRTANG